MSDKEKLIELLTSFGIKFEDEGSHVKISADGECEKIDGYFYFYTIFEFSEEGNFVQIGIWE